MRQPAAAILLKHTPLLMSVALFVFFCLASPSFLQVRTLENIAKQASYIGIVAVGMTFVLLTAGIDLSVGSNMYLSAVVAGLLIDRFQVPVTAALAACLATGLVFGTVNALLITRFRVIPFVATLCTMVSGRGLALALTESRAVPFPERVIRLGASRIHSVPLPIILFALVTAGAWIFLSRTLTGRQMYALGNDPEKAARAGIDTARVLRRAYMICGLLAALGGFVSVIQLGIINAGFGEGDEFDAIAAAVLGGTSLFGGAGTVFPGTVIGALLIQMINAGLVFTRTDLYLQPMVTAAIIFAAVFLDSLRHRWAKRLARRHIRIEEKLTRQTYPDP